MISGKRKRGFDEWRKDILEGIPRVVAQEPPSADTLRRIVRKKSSSSFPILFMRRGRFWRAALVHPVMCRQRFRYRLAEVPRSTDARLCKCAVRRGLRPEFTL